VIARNANSVEVGGLAGRQGELGTTRAEHGYITQSYATGPVTVFGYGYVGGLVGQASGTIVQSFATGPVKVASTYGSETEVGGLVGWSQYAIIRQSFASGSVTNTSAANGGDFAALVGLGWYYVENIIESYGVGKVAVTRGSGSIAGGLMADIYDDPSLILRSTWDTQTTHQLHSVAGKPRTTAQLQGALPAEIKLSGWAITPGVSYP
jgi:hypothetical protein